MAFEVFRRGRGKSPTVAIGTTGRFRLNHAAARLLIDESVNFAVLLWDAETRRVAIQPIETKGANTYRLNREGKGMGRGFTARTFLKYIGVDYTRGQQVFPAVWNTDAKMFEIDLSAAAFVERPAVNAVGEASDEPVADPARR